MVVYIFQKKLVLSTHLKLIREIEYLLKKIVKTANTR